MPTIPARLVPVIQMRNFTKRKDSVRKTHRTHAIYLENGIIRSGICMPIRYLICIKCISYPWLI